MLFNFISLAANAFIMFCCGLCLYLLYTSAIKNLKYSVRRKDYNEVFGASVMFFIILVACFYQVIATGKVLIITIDPLMVYLMTGA